MGPATSPGRSRGRPRGRKDSRRRKSPRTCRTWSLYSSLAIGRDGTPHISYQDVTNADLKVAVKHQDGWLLSTVDAQGDVGDAHGPQARCRRPGAVSYYDLQHGALKLAAEGVDGNWATQTVDADGNVGAYCSLAVDEAGGLRVRLPRRRARLEQVRRASRAAAGRGRSWTAGTGAGHGTALALARGRRAGDRVHGAHRAGRSGWCRRASARWAQSPTDRAGLRRALSRALLRGGALTVTFAIPQGGGEAEVSLIDVTGRRVARWGRRLAMPASSRSPGTASTMERARFPTASTSSWAARPGMSRSSNWWWCDEHGLAGQAPRDRAQEPRRADRRWSHATRPCSSSACSRAQATWWPRSACPRVPRSRRVCPAARRPRRGWRSCRSRPWRLRCR